MRTAVSGRGTWVQFGQSVVAVYDVSRLQETMERSSAGGSERPTASMEISQCGRYPVRCARVKYFTIVEPQHAELGVADTGGVLQNRIKHRPQLARRARDDLQYLRGRGLLLQRLGK